MTRICMLPLLLLLTLPLAAAPDLPKASAFVDTNPMGARISIDGALIAEGTPALIRGLKPGKHTVTLGKPGFETVTRTFETSETAVPEVSVSLPPSSVSLAFPDVSQIAGPVGSIDTTGQQFRFPTGAYTVENHGEVLSVTPVFPDEGLLAAASWGLAVVSGAALIATASDVWHVTAGWGDHPNTLTVGLWVTALFDLPWYLSVQARKDRFVRDAAPQVTPAPESPDPLPRLIAQGEAALEAGDLAKAEDAFGQVVQGAPTSNLVPGAWFRLARIHAATGRRDLAMGEYRIVAETYPQAAYHDRARKALADLYQAAKNGEAAADQLDHMVLTDGYFDPADIAAQRAKLTQEAPVVP